ncbi:amino acid adenylation domain-containing protein [Kitasatospora camelliae]|uniref:Amino acid adenylation domain-containing protein n=1 Tax=Kitasatospora camelliae TaxID=3156397 RepID=A0AAU8K394_9ACTN
MDKPNHSKSPGGAQSAVLRNDVGQYAIWPESLPVPDGWTAVSGPAPRSECLDVVRSRWHDLRPVGPSPHGRTVPELFRRQAARTPHAVAVLSEDGPLDYRALDRRSDRLAAGLRERDVGPESVVPVCLERTADMVAALLGVLKAGGAFMPLDPAHPASRLRNLVRSSGAATVISAHEQSWLFGPAAVTVEDCVALAGDRPPAREVLPEDLAYLIYTSGTTGVPKGVLVNHRALAFALSRVAEAYGLTPEDRVLQLGALGFDTSLEQILAPLISGSTLVLGGRHTWAPIELAYRIPELRLTVADLTPTYWHRFLEVLADGGRPPAALRLLIVGGDTVHAEDCRTSLRRLPGTRLLNAYGLTEAGITSTLCDLDEGLLHAPAHAPVPVGRPLLGAHVHVLDEKLGPVPPGRRGEVYIGGLGVARGYWGSPDLTAQVFLPDPYAGGPGGRMYRTGDAGRWRPDGNLELLGRTDEQVKVRGFRVDPAEVEAVLAEHPGVGQARVLAVDEDGGTRSLTAYYTRTGQETGDIREFLAERLPDYLVPASFVAVEQMPVTPAGKVDRQSLVKAGPPAGRGGNGGTATEHGLAYLWAQLLGVDEVGALDDFFELGGNSLLAMEMLARARIMFGLGIGLVRELTRALLRNPTLGAFTAMVQEARSGIANGSGVPERIDFTAEAELGVPVRRTAGATPAWERPREILLTGATGFCGAHLLENLLARTDARVHCLVRAPDREHGMERLRAAHQRYLRHDLSSQRVVPLVGDLAEPLLGLGRPRFEQLADSLDAIHHLGGQVNFLYPYRQLRAANVAGTREVIRLAGHSRGIPVHYLSSMAVMAGFGPAGIGEISEETPLGHPEHLSVGYVESKWVAEALLHNAASAGLPVAVYRVNDVTGDLVTGTTNTATELYAIIKYLADSGSCPDVQLPLDFVPADSFTRALAHLAVTAPADGRVYHLTNPSPALLPALADRLTARGRPVRRIPYQSWVEQLVAYASEHPEHPITPFVPLFVDRSAGTDLSISEMYFHPTFPRFTRINAERELRGTGIEFPPVDDGLLDFYLDRLESHGHLEQAA